MKILSILKANKSKDIFPVDRLPLLKATVFGTTMVTLLLNGSPTIADGFATAEKNVEMLETFNEIPHEKNKFISKISSNNEGYDASIIFDRTQEGDDVRGINLFFPSGVRRSKSWKMTASTVSREEDATVDAVYPNALQGEEKERIRDYKNVIKTEEGEEETHQKGDDRLIISTVGSDPTTLISIVRNRNNDNRDDVSLHVADFHDEALRLQSANSRSVNDLLCTGSSNVMCIGVYSKALGMGSVALGYESQAIRGPGVYGYDPITNTISTKNDQYWKSSHGELGIGNTANGTSRQITGVAAGREDNEAVNVAQLKALRQWTEDNNFFSFRKGGGINGGSEISIGFSGVDAGRVNLINIGHSNGTKRILRGVQNGIADNDAVNMFQLSAFKQEVESYIRFRADAGVGGSELAIGWAGVNIGRVTSITIGHSNGMKRILRGVKEGQINASSDHAMTGSQIFNINKAVENYFGGGAVIGVNGGANTAPIFKIQGTNYRNVSAAFSGVDLSLAQIKKDLAGITQGGNDNALSWNKDIGLTDPSTGKPLGAYDASHGGKLALIANVADGQIDEKSNYVVTGRQIHSINKSVEDYFGGGAVIGVNGGANTAPTFTIQGTDYRNVSAAFSGVDLSLTQIKKDLAGITQGENDNALSWNKDIGLTDPSTGKPLGAYDASHGGKLALIANVADGQIDEKSNYVVTGRQIHSINKSVEDYFGGGAVIGVNGGANTAPTFTIQGTDYRNVSAAFSGVDLSLAQIKKDLAGITQGENDNALSWNKDIGLTDPSTGKPLGAYDASHGGKLALIANVADGQIDEKSNYVVTGRQIHSINKSVEDYFGGGAVIGVNGGANTAPTFTIQGTDYRNVSAAFSGVDLSLTQIKKDLAGITQGGNDNALSWNKDIGPTDPSTGKPLGAYDASHGGKLALITNVADGQIDEKSNYVVTGRQIHSINKSVENYFGGGAVIGVNGGANTAPTFTIQGTDYRNVSAAFSGVDLSLAQIKKDLAGITQGENDNALSWNKDIGPTDPNTGKPLGAYDASHGGKLALIANVADGQIDEKSNYVVTGRQIHSINKSVENYFGGGAVIGVNGGANTAPTFTIQGSDYHNVAAAFSGVDLSLTQIKNDVSKVGENALVWSEKDGAFVALHREGDENKKSKLKFLLDGSITDQSTEAITGNQLYSLNKQLASYFGGGAEFNNERWTNPVFNVIQFLADGSLSSRKSYNNVGDAFNGMNETIAGLNNRINDLEQGHGGNNNSLNWNEKEGAYDASHGGKPSSIVNVADGKVEEGSKDAVNGGQLWDVKNDLENKINDLENSIDGANNGAAVVYDKDENGKKTNSITLQGGDEGKPVLIDNVADGKIEEGSKQAINGGQLYEYTKEQTEIVLEESKKYTDMRFDTLSYAVEDAKKEARQSAAIGLAVANLRYDDTPGALSIAFGSGLWRSQSAFAFGAGYTSEDGKIRSNFSMTNTGRHWGIGAGLSVTLN